MSSYGFWRFSRSVPGQGVNLCHQTRGRARIEPNEVPMCLSAREIDSLVDRLVLLSPRVAPRWNRARFLTAAAGLSKLP